MMVSVLEADLSHCFVGSQTRKSAKQNLFFSVWQRRRSYRQMPEPRECPVPEETEDIEVWSDVWAASKSEFLELRQQNELHSEVVRFVSFRHAPEKKFVSSGNVARDWQSLRSTSVSVTSVSRLKFFKRLKTQFGIVLMINYYSVSLVVCMSALFRSLNGGGRHLRDLCTSSSSVSMPPPIDTPASASEVRRVKCETQTEAVLNSENGAMFRQSDYRLQGNERSCRRFSVRCRGH